ncbi:MAG: malonic semialdehyde reductase [Alphaproteobacteria bacterium]|nr:malonic semialdehyde reductase [Alphaproteobacteria bacterium]MBT5389533.1 malonic semialdehyde reductase [Alphaproteobacteria bacterium]MBT5540831.1 malonic semialdehyde reductase [Alphaproteobacteria bacterium]MBT5653886.1 malonic semialdehyde reductase [Alphaproteobacteria bacterium]
MDRVLSEEALKIIFEEARTHFVWTKRTVEKDLLESIYKLAALGPTSANCCPLRILFIQSSQDKERLKPFLDPGNVGKTMSAPITAVFAYDLEFYERLPELFPQTDAKSWFEGKDQLIIDTAKRNATLQAAYFMIAARSLGLDCGPMSGFDNEGVNGEFFPDGILKSDFLCNLGYGDPKALYPRAPRLSFDTVAKIL